MVARPPPQGPRPPARRRIMSRPPTPPEADCKKAAGLRLTALVFFAPLCRFYDFFAFSYKVSILSMASGGEVEYDKLI